VVILGASTVLTIGLPDGSKAVRASTPYASIPAGVHITDSERTQRHIAAPATVSTPTTTTTTATAATRVLAPKPPVTTQFPAHTAAQTTTATEPSVGALVAEVEAAGIDPGSSWKWSMGNTATQCGAIPGNGAGTGCTFGAAGLEQSVFAGSPSLALIAHELANAETGNDAVPSLVSEVAGDEAGTSWSPMDAVASCLVEHFMGFQDEAAGAWQCPVALATVVSENIHDAVSTTEIAQSCGTTSGIISTLIFTGTAGTLTVTAPALGAVPETVAAGTPVAVSGIGTFSAIDHGGAITQIGACGP